jgi:uncharacterized BrkB/YihY/UPF0761 family membrane protein
VIPPITIARIALLLVGIACFAYALNTRTDWARWVAIGCVAVALLLRFVDRSRRR